MRKKGRRRSELAGGWGGGGAREQTLLGQLAKFEEGM